MLRRVTAENLLVARGAPFDRRERVEQEGQTLRALGVIPGRVQLGETPVAVDVYRVLAASLSASPFSPQERTSSAPPSQSGCASGSFGSGAFGSMAAILR
jgi:hypothetical protein